ncbi:MAG: hypothetical protein AUJ98_05735 [Bacteroidetes bacterium CG2_30_33_31]|nr:MAG: hypothetical protein AUJ98_05735 [Bacteroidetes bacterium CG2_30_33_31]
MTFFEIIILIVAGVLVGFINTLAGGGSIISLSLLMFMGLPANVANGTNRIAIFLQTLTATREFKKAGLLTSKKAYFLGIPAVFGSVVGSFIAIEINKELFEKVMVAIMVVMLFFIFYKPSVWLKGKQELLNKKSSWFQYLIFFFIGIYGGFIHAGIGYLLLISLVLGAGFDLLQANAVKTLIVLMFIPFSLLVFAFGGQINYIYGLVLAIGNIIGAFVASKFAVEKGANFVRWVILIVVIVTALHIFGLIDFGKIFTKISLK